MRDAGTRRAGKQSPPPGHGFSAQQHIKGSFYNQSEDERLEPIMKINLGVHFKLLYPNVLQVDSAYWSAGNSQGPEFIRCSLF